MIIRGGVLLNKVQPITFSAGAGIADQGGNPSFNHVATQDDDVVVDVYMSGANSITGVNYAGSLMKLKAFHRFPGGGGNGWIMKFGKAKVAAGTNAVQINGGSAWMGAECNGYKNVHHMGAARRAKGSSTSMSQAVAVPPSGMSQLLFAATPAMSALAGGNTRSYRGAQMRAAVRDADAAVTMTGTLASSSGWGGLYIPLSAALDLPYLDSCWGLGASALGPNLSFTLPGVVAGDQVAVDVVIDRSGTAVNWVTVGGEDTFLLKSQTFTGIVGNGFHGRYVVQPTSSGDKTVAINLSNGSAWCNANAVSLGGFNSAGTTVSGSGSSSTPSRAVTPLTNGLTLVTFALANGGSIATDAGTHVWDSWMNNNCSLYTFVTDRAETLALSSSTNWSYIETPIT